MHRYAVRLDESFMHFRVNLELSYYICIKDVRILTPSYVTFNKYSTVRLTRQLEDRYRNRVDFVFKLARK